jgi:hypothetical protein
LNKKYTYILAGITCVVATSLIFIYVLKKIKSKTIIVKGKYKVPENIENRVDALHSFERRKSDGFGGRMTSKINEQLMKLYKKGINPDVTDVKINVDSKNYIVTWEAKVQPNKDGKAYIGITTFGSAGNDADKRALAQFEEVKNRVEGEDYKLVLDFKNPKNIYIRQFFYKYTKEKDFPSH